MKRLRHKLIRGEFVRRWGRGVALLAVMSTGLRGFALEPAEGQWKTAFVKRGIVGAIKDEGLCGGSGAILRTRTPIPFDGTALRVRVSGCYKTVVELGSMAFVRGTDDLGTVTGPHHPVLFKGKPSVTLNGITSRWSDAMPIPVRRGTWYVEDSYPGSQMPYAYDVDFATCGATGTSGKERFAKKLNVRAGALVRVDVFTTDPRPVIVCYGDSITHGFGSTPNAGKRYPDQLALLLDRPVLNLGVNSDGVNSAGGAPGEIGLLKGVDTVVFMMGINDILRKSVQSVPDFTKKVAPMIAALQQQDLKVFVGTIPPAGGLEQYDRKPERDALRVAINEWIRLKCKADGVADFDRALRDPKTPSRMMADCQMDWVHPNDLGYRKMAEAAAAAITAAPAGRPKQDIGESGRMKSAQ